MALAERRGVVLPANPLQRGLLAPLRLCRRWQSPDKCPPGGNTREVGPCYDLAVLAAWEVGLGTGARRSNWDLLSHTC